MGIFDVLRKLAQGGKSKAKNKDEKSEKEKVVLSDLGTWTENKIQKQQAKEKVSINFIQKKVESLEEELKEKINAVKSFDINAKKEDDRIKSAVEDARQKYLESVEYLISSLSNLKEERLEKAIAHIDKALLDFNKRSGKSYEKATILIGKEMREIKESLKTFSKSLIKIFDENKNLMESSRLVFLIKSRSSQIGKIEDEIKKVAREMAFLDNELVNKEKESRETLQEIEEIKKSPEYLEKQKNQEKLSAVKKELEKEILSLRQIIDFKALGNFYHVFEDKIQIVKAHRDDFLENFQKDSGKTILNLLETAKLNNQNTSDKFNQINKKKQEILKLETRLENKKDKDKTKEMYSANTKTILEIDDLKNRKSRKEKRLEKLKADKEKIISELKESLEKLGAELN